MGPASQQILTTFSTDLCTSMFGNVFTVNNVQNQTIVDTVDISRNIHKLTEIEEDYLIPFALKRAAYHLDPPYSFICPAEALNCSYNSVPILYTVPECTQGSLQTKVVDVAAKNVTTLYDLFSYNSTMQLAILQPQLPRIYYAESMLGRTAAELDALPRVTWGTGANITLSQYIGDQSFVVATLRNTTETNYANAKDVVVLQCTLRSFSTEVTFTYDTAAQKMSWKEDRSLPLKFDYESMVTDANNVKPVYLNAYGLQISVLKHLAYDKKRDNMLFDMARTWSIKHGKDASFLEYFQDILTHLGVTITTAAITDFPNFYTRPTFCFRSPVMYHFEPSTYYGLVLSLLVPLLWWVVTWITSLYKTNGISRGNSQVALLVTGLTPAVAEKLRGYSHAGQSALFKRARQVQAVFGETKAGSDRRGHVAFGTKEEMNSIRPRRSSIDSRI
ncbi:uncharacterized protein BYT42DRAFT_582602 [Radiomyces spectabilis]|uniref:uncharacterized protein n=1 Tax=Radiomyces spectabilis TaxID=64574 RepID=UPI00221EEF5C|nr:uncharacterized protein BYT42DRAFT_582602 [Radiomyces spectabilis]KAI8370490.1 hypothetical protein BYT42DRAFT_582602 [Radiomyces spectabilis]